MTGDQKEDLSSEEEDDDDDDDDDDEECDWRETRMANGDVYYANEWTNTTQWDVPIELKEWCVRPM